MSGERPLSNILDLPSPDLTYAGRAASVRLAQRLVEATRGDDVDEYAAAVADVVTSDVQGALSALAMIADRAARDAAEQRGRDRDAYLTALVDWMLHTLVTAGAT